jgi:hypothetical protein
MDHVLNKCSAFDFDYLLIKTGTISSIIEKANSAANG